MTPGYFVYLSHGTNWEERVAGTGLAAVVLLCLSLYVANLLLLAGYCVVVSVEASRAAVWPEEANDVSGSTAAD